MTSLPAQLASLSLQLPIKFRILDGMNSKASEVDLPTAVGRPRYFSANYGLGIRVIRLIKILIKNYV